MAVKLKVTITQNSQDTTNNTSSVTVKVITSWTYGSFNHYDPPGWCKINGTRYTFNARLNSNRSTTGSETIFTKTVTIKHNSDGKQHVSVYASYSTNLTSGVIAAAASKTLTTIAQTTKTNKTKSTAKKTTTNKAVVTKFDLQNETDRTLFATWTWSKTNTENYKITWYYATGDGVWFVGEDSTTTYKQCTYSAPSNATKVKFLVKPVAKKRKVNKKETPYWTAEWSTAKVYNFGSYPITPSSAPTVTIENLKLTAEYDNLDVNATHIQFQVVKNDKSIFKTGTATITKTSATWSCKVTAGNEYKVRARSQKGKLYSDWTEYSSGTDTRPATPTGFTKLRASSETSIYLAWSAVSTATSYDLQYATKKTYFSVSDQTTIITGITTTSYEKTGLESGQEYFFRLRAVNDSGESSWTAIKSVIIGDAPAAPTTWSSSTTVITGDPLYLYWVHNTEDGSKETLAELELYVDGVKSTQTIKNSSSHDEENPTSEYSIDTSSYVEGTKLEWRVRTAGITKIYGDWSVQRTVDIYAPATLEFKITDAEENIIEILTGFPFYVYGLPGPNTQAPIGYHLAVTANETYRTVDRIGNPITVKEGEEVYSKYFDIAQEFLVEMSADNIDLENNISYTATCVVSMNSGLTAEESQEFTVGWEETFVEPGAEISIDLDVLTATIRPFCEYHPFIHYKVEYDEENDIYTTTSEEIDEVEGELIESVYTTTYEDVYSVTLDDGSTLYFCLIEAEEATVVDDVTLAVYRREFDGKFTEIASDIENSNTFVTDPHPALDYARYRIVATNIETGAVSYYDVPPEPVGVPGAVLQWSEDWSNFDNDNPDAMEDPPWSGSMLRLPYNVDVSDSHSADVSLIEYIGREHPVSYYGTQLGETSSWSMEIPKDDEETLYGLRRLAVWMGDVYVRESSGTGYWANVAVSISQTHGEVKIPISLDVTRVEGGM